MRGWAGSKGGPGGPVSLTKRRERGAPRSAGHGAPRVPAGDQRVHARDPGEQGARGAGRAAAPGAAGRPRRPALPDLVRRTPPSSAPPLSALPFAGAFSRQPGSLAACASRTAGPAARRRDWGLQEGDRLVITGSLPQLGNWQPRQPLAMAEVATPHWEAEARRPALHARRMTRVCARMRRTRSLLGRSRRGAPIGSSYACRAGTWSAPGSRGWDACLTEALVASALRRRVCMRGACEGSDEHPGEKSIGRGRQQQAAAHASAPAAARSRQRGLHSRPDQLGPHAAGARRRRGAGACAGRARARTPPAAAAAPRARPGRGARRCACR